MRCPFPRCPFPRYVRPGRCLCVLFVCFGVAMSATSSRELRADPVLTLDVTIPDVDRKIKELEDAVALFKQGKVDDCMRQLVAAVDKHTDLPPAKLLLARLLLAAGQFGAGHEFAEQAVAEHPDRPEPYLLFGDVALEQGRVSDAALHFEKAASVPPVPTWSASQRKQLAIRIQAGQAVVAERRRGWSNAERSLRAWLELDPKNTNTQLRLANALFQQDRRDEARQQIEQARQESPALEPAKAILAKMHLARGERKETRTLLDEAVRENPDDAGVHLNLAGFLLAEGDVDAAQAQAAQARSLGLESRELRMTLGLIARQQKQWKKAESIFEALQRESPADFEASNQLALVLIAQEDEPRRRRALELAELNARQYPRSSDALATLGWTYFRMQRTEEAERLLKTCATAGEVRSDTTYYLVRVLEARGDRGGLQQAIPLLDAATKGPGVFAHREDALQWLGSHAKTK